MKIKHIADVFSSIQGEGLFVGEHQVFIRFAECNLRCPYCDTQNLTSKTISLKRLVKKVKLLSDNGNLCNTVSVTGGEPLLHVEYLKDLFLALKTLKYKVYLETNGALPLNLKKIIKFVDYISMDIKLPTSSGLDRPLWKEHHLFLRTADKHLKRKDKKSLFVKIVATKSLKFNEFKKAVRIIAKINKNIPLVIQPVTPSGSVKERVNIKAIIKLLEIAKKELKNVLVIPQVHKILGVK